jgi:hypothetical protein
MTLSGTALQVASLVSSAAVLVGGFTGLTYSPTHARADEPASKHVRHRCHCDSFSCPGWRYIEVQVDDEEGTEP